MIWLIGLGGVAGTLARFYGGKWMNARTGSSFPWGTWAINISGSLLLGILFGLHEAGRLSEGVWLTLGTGFCGAYTTFSTFGHETVQLVSNGQTRRAALYVLSSVVLGLASAGLGLAFF
ncbi:fluoride efflux transporter CrcB [Paenibacillus methanolicus]|uniref:Fluoride-specific ion channel FluC n=1 Tax=Paenibacillus methanolicus TaxID=582686 RepID=A0A5S5C915_9BACL|nr:fluoride efflux transporter CrcB [Paenibacillus methanolicus]TYP74876.1 CrcB protein [Paenibacillus methanolicus]